MVQLWPVLPPAIRDTILMLANTSDPATTPPLAKEHRDRLPPGDEKRADP